jgi:hypothetical protein
MLTALGVPHVDALTRSRAYVSYQVIQLLPNSENVTVSVRI